jgi:hypothetical protein
MENENENPVLMSTCSSFQGAQPYVAIDRAVLVEISCPTILLLQQV